MDIATRVRANSWRVDVASEQLHLTHNLFAILGSSLNLDNRVWDTFQVTPKMPTYLVAFVVCEYSYITDAAKFISVYVRENAIQYARYAQEAATKMIKQMELYTGIRYSLPKMDLVTVPHFRSGAMENWGLTTYR